MASTTKGIVYPTSGDNIAPLETHFASLAQSADDAVAEVETFAEEVETALDAFKVEVGKIPQVASYTFSAPTSIATPEELTITLPPGYFETAPTVIATVSGTSRSAAYLPIIHSVTTSQFQARIWRVFANANLGTVTISIATPAVITDVGHGLVNGDLVYFTTTNTLPTGILAGSITTNNYFVRNATADTFNISSTVDGALINTSGSQSGTHTLFRAAQESLSLNWIAK